MNYVERWKTTVFVDGSILNGHFLVNAVVLYVLVWR